jgi:hydrogenase maturation protease
VTRALVAGVGNVFFGDDGFGCEVARRLGAALAPDGVVVADFGIRGVHLAFELSSGYDVVIIVDAVRRGGRAGTLYVIDPALEPDAAKIADAHGVDLGTVLAMARTLGSSPHRLFVIGCEAGDLGDHIGLSAPMRQAIEPAMALVQSLLRDGAQAVGGANHETRAQR